MGMIRQGTIAAVAATLALAATLATGSPSRAAGPAPQPLVSANQPVDWWFVFKFNSSAPFAGCGPVEGTRTCPFGGQPLTQDSFGQQFAFASSANSALQNGHGCLGAQTEDPVGASFDEVYNGKFYYVLWNDQFYGDPKVCGKSDNCDGPWGHSKGLLAWNDDGEGFIMQVSTPSWPGSGTSRIKRKVGNTLGCVSTNNNLRASQHFFALKLGKSDLLDVLDAMRTASVATDPSVAQVVFNGGPKDVQDRVFKLGQRPAAADNFPLIHKQLSIKIGGKPVQLIAKPSNLNVPPWQLVSSLLGGASARTATWWTAPKIDSTIKSSTINCWSSVIDTKSGPVAIALTGEWQQHPINLYAPSNHAKIGIATIGQEHYAIFGDLNQQGRLTTPKCDSSQNGRGGMFFVLQDEKLYQSLENLVDGNTAPAAK